MPQKHHFKKIVKLIELLLEFLTTLFVTSQTPNCIYCVVIKVRHDKIM